MGATQGAPLLQKVGGHVPQSTHGSIPVGNAHINVQKSGGRLEIDTKAEGVKGNGAGIPPPQLTSGLGSVATMDSGTEPLLPSNRAPPSLK